MLPSRGATLDGSNEAWVLCERHAVAVAPHAVSVRALLRFLGRTRPATDILPRGGLRVVAIGAAQTPAGGIWGAVVIVAPRDEGLGGAVFVASVVVKDRHPAAVTHPFVVGSDVRGRIPSLHLSRQDRDREGGAMRQAMGAFMGIGRGGRGAQGQFQAQVPVDIGGCEVHVAKDALFVGGVFGVKVIADLGLEVRGHLGSGPEQLALKTSTEGTPCEAHRRDLVCGQAQQCGDLLTVRACGVPV